VADAALSDPFALVGTTLDGQFRVEKVVGEGGFGVVYKGRHLSLEQPIAIKALKVSDADERAIQEQLFAKFKSEAQLLYTLSQASLHIVRSMDFGEVTSPSGIWTPYMILEWLEGRSLAEDLDQRRRRGLRGRTVDEAFALLEGAAEGLSIAHERRVAHRDVKPGNFFIVASQGRETMKVLDFGIAKVLREEGDAGGTKSKFASFTWAYAAPEQVDPRIGETGLATDVYAFALVLTEMLTDRQPIDSRDVVSLVKSATDPTIRPTPRTRGGNVTDAIEVVCRKALAVDPRARHQTMGELWNALQTAYGGRPSAISALPASTSLPTVVAQRPGTMAVPSTQAPQPAPPSFQGYPPTALPASPPRTGQPVMPQQPMGPPMGPGGPMMPYNTTGPFPQPPTQWGPRRPIPTGDNTIIIIVVIVVLSGMFVGSCALLHAC
jgi:serine/threonine-protein kinase